MPPELTNLPPELAPPTPAPAPVAPEGSNPAGEPKEMSAELISEFVQLSEEGGWSEGPALSGDNFPDLPPVVEPSAAPPVATPSPAPVASPTPAVPPVPQVVPAVAPVPVVAPVEPAPAVAPAPVPAAVPAPTPTPAAVPAVATTGTPGEAGAVPDPFRVLAEEVGKQEEAFIQALAKQNYAISEEDHNAFLAGDTGKLSVLCARIHTQAVGSVMRTISAYLPVVVNALVQQGRTEENREARFWDANPHLKKSEHAQLLPKVLQTYNALNPGVDEAKRFREVGILMAQLHNIPIGQPQVPVVQAVPAVRTPGPVVRSVSPPTYSPAGASGAPPASPVPNGPANPWADFTEFALATEQGRFDQRE